MITYEVGEIEVMPEALFGNMSKDDKLKLLQFYNPDDIFNGFGDEKKEELYFLLRKWLESDKAPLTPNAKLFSNHL